MDGVYSGPSPDFKRKLDPKASLVLLPPELILKILFNIPDLASLWKFIEAWIPARRVFAANIPANIVEAALTAGYTCKQIQTIFRFLALLRSDKISPQDITGHRENASGVPGLPADLESAETGTYQLPPLALDTKLCVIYPLLMKARDITNESLHYLGEALVLFRSVEPRRQAVSEEIDWNEVPNTSSGDVLKFLNGAPSDGILVGKDDEPPTWVEEQRVMRAFWHLQFEHDYRCILLKADESLINKDGKSTTGHHCKYEWQLRHDCEECPVEARCKPGSADNTILYTCKHAHDKGHHAEMSKFIEIVTNSHWMEARSVQEYIRRRFGEELAEGVDRSSQQMTAWLSKVEKGEQATEEGTSFHNTPLSRDASRRWRMPMPAKNDGEALIYPFIPNDRQYILHGQFDILFRDSMSVTVSRYGFAFWSKERMQRYGLAAPQTVLPEAVPEETQDMLQEQKALEKTSIHWTWMYLLASLDVASNQEGQGKEKGEEGCGG